MSIYNVVKEADVIIDLPVVIGNEVLQVLEYLDKESGWLRIERLTDVWSISVRSVDNTLSKWEEMQVGFVLLRTGEIFIRGERVDPYSHRHEAASGVALGLLHAMSPTLYNDVLEALPPPIQW